MHDEADVQLTRVEAVRLTEAAEEGWAAQVSDGVME